MLDRECLFEQPAGVQGDRKIYGSVDKPVTPLPVKIVESGEKVMVAIFMGDMCAYIGGGLVSLCTLTYSLVNQSGMILLFNAVLIKYAFGLGFDILRNYILRLFL